MKCISVNIIMLTILLAMQSCIREDTSDCTNTALRLDFRYTLNNQYSDLFGPEVAKVTVYIFDADNKYVGSYTEAGDNLRNKYILTIPLAKGCYQAVVFCDNINTFTSGWLDNQTNLIGGELKPGITTISDFRIMLNSVEDSDGFLIPESIPGDLFAGYVSHASSTYDAAHITTVDLMKDTKNIEVKINGLNYLTRSVAIPDIYVTAINGRYKNDNSIDTYHHMMKYIPHHTYVMGNTLDCKLRTMRLVIGHAPMLVIKNPVSSGYLINQDLTELILSNPHYISQEDIDRENKFLLEFNFSQVDNDIVISILINGWKINTITPAND